ncbi:glycosyltransferase family 4 protein [Desulfopila inferna]|uniref:glycosyltransferase family 4 protein n=1 Tax=Desulfopila inferna TaxID=468528 RepID=UPI0019668572|nr:glycosyltransferase family 1 protein [Desulfopila inferna]MBM9602712.1 glycosyltransferase family 4 protein [Desulfopila inferna]
MSRIGIMMRSADEVGGISVYARNIVRELLEIDTENQYVLFYKTDKHLGLYQHYDNCREILLKGGNKAVWDQFIIPRAVKKEKIDLVFNPKFTVPLFTSAKTVMAVHGADWFIPPYDQVYTAIDNFYIKRVMPLYFKKADFITSVSDYSTDGFVNAFPWCKDKIQTIYFGPNKIFKPVTDPEKLKKIRKKYDLPERFLLTVIRYDHGARNTRKNFKGMAEGYAKYRQLGGEEKFVVVGRDCHLYAEEYDLKAMGVSDHIVFTGLVDQEDLPAFYSLAQLYLYPTIIEAFPIPTTEAMACGCPIVTSDGTGLKELTENVSITVDPTDTDAIAAAIVKVQSDEKLKESMIQKGFERSKIFSWRKCAEETLKIFDRLIIS